MNNQSGPENKSEGKPSDSTLLASMAQALVHLEAGQMTEAEETYRKILASRASDDGQAQLYADIYLNLGIICQLDENPGEAIANYQMAIKDNSQLLNAYIYMGDLLQVSGRAGEAEDVFRHALEAIGEQSDLLLGLGISLQSQEKFKDSTITFQRVAELEPDNAIVHSNLSTTLAEQGRLEEALASCRRAVEINPGFVEACDNLGHILHLQGKWDEAISWYKQALSLAPDFSQAHCHLGAAFNDTRNFGDGAESCRRALELRPDYPIAHNNLGVSLQGLGRWEEAANSFRDAIRLNPNYLEAHFWLATDYWLLGEDARDEPLFRAAFDRWPDNHLLKLLIDTNYPVITTTEVFDERRREINETLGGYDSTSFNFLLADLSKFARPLPFHLAYHGRDNLNMKSKYADLFADYFKHKFPKLYSNADVNLSLKKEISRVGFFVTLPGPFSVWLKEIVKEISREKFRVTIICPRAAHAFLAEHFGEDSNIDYVFINSDFEMAIKEIRAQAFDVIVYHEVGTNPMNYFLPFFRLAPVQCVSYAYGHSTGVSTMDYYVTSDLFEPENSECYYREELIRFPSLSFVFEKPELPVERFGRTHFGFSDSDHLYTCAQNLIKVHPDVDEVFGEILREDTAALVVLIENERPAHSEALMSRFRAAFPDCASRVRMLPRLNQEEFFSLLAESDVLLDSIHSCGGTTTLHSLAVGTPLITWPGEFARGRFTYACYEKMGVLDCVAANLEDFAGLALSFGNNRDQRDAVKKKILDANHLVFEDDAAVGEWENFFETAMDAARKSP